MQRLKLLMALFAGLLAIPLAYFVYSAYVSIGQEEIAELRFFTETLFDRIEEDLSRLVQQEEARGIDEYGTKGAGSQLAGPFGKNYIIGYFQGSSQGEMQPVAASLTLSADAGQLDSLTSMTKRLNEQFALMTAAGAREDASALPQVATAAPQQEIRKSVEEKYFAKDREKKQKVHLGQEAKRYEEIPVSQLRDIVDEEKTKTSAKKGATKLESMFAASGTATVEGGNRAKSSPPAPAQEADKADFANGAASSNESPAPLGKPSWSAERSLSVVKESVAHPQTFQIVVAPLQSMLVDDQHLFLFRRIEIENQIYRQGLVVNLNKLLESLMQQYFLGEPLAAFSRLRLAVYGQNGEIIRQERGSTVEEPRFSQARNFPRPFAFLQASLDCKEIPRSAGRQTLRLMAFLLSLVILAGLAAIYKSVKVVVELSERRAGFVSAVTHELKTPLTNIRMYIEMLEQGIAASKERQADYFRILNSESRRLSRLIQNVLEFSRLEKKNRPIIMEKGNLNEVLAEVLDILGEKARQEGFLVIVRKADVESFAYDREAMIQILVNLVENSMKFGNQAQNREIVVSITQTQEWTEISVLDHGPGIGRKNLKKIFDDFFREDNSLTRTTKGTGIGLALVKKLVNGMGGNVSATNNNGPGCTITVTLRRDQF